MYTGHSVKQLPEYNRKNTSSLSETKTWKYERITEYVANGPVQKQNWLITSYCHNFN